MVIKLYIKKKSIIVIISGYNNLLTKSIHHCNLLVDLNCWLVLLIMWLVIILSVLSIILFLLLLNIDFYSLLLEYTQELDNCLLLFIYWHDPCIELILCDLNKLDPISNYLDLDLCDKLFSLSDLNKSIYDSLPELNPNLLLLLSN